MTPTSERLHRPLTPAMFHVLLALHEGRAHGYAVMMAARRSAGEGVPMGPSTVYGTLDRLASAGLVRESAGPDGEQRLFELTSGGRRRLRAEARRLVRWTEDRRVRALLGEETG